MNYSETLVPMSAREKKKQLLTFVVLILLPLFFFGTGYLLKPVNYFWAVFCWIAAGVIILFLWIPKTIRLIKDDFFSHKIIYKGIVQEVRAVTVGVSTSSSILHEFVLEKKTLKISEKGLIEIKLLDVPLPVRGEEVEIHALPKSGEIIKLLVYRNNKWESVALA